MPDLYFSVNRFGARGIVLLCDALRRGVAPRLEKLNLNGLPVGDEGALALATALGIRSLM